MKRIGIGCDNFKKFIDQDLYYVDKTLLVQDVLERGGEVTLLTRPRRFGKTLGLSMLQTFFELETDEQGNAIDKTRYFKGMRVMDCGDEVLSLMGRYPVIKLSFKSAAQGDFQTAFTMLRKEVIFECDRHSYLNDSQVLNEREKERFRELWLGENKWEERAEKLKNEKERNEAFREEIGKYAVSIKELSAFLKKHHGENVIILIDEYDVPLEKAWHAGFYQEMIVFIRSLFESALKTNDALERAVITGCLRISRESVFTGMNNLNVISIRSADFTESFGFTQTETEKMLADYNLSHKVEEVRDWYDGYLFGNTEIYNPWSVTKYVYAHRSAPDSFPEPYWANTSSNSIIKDLIIRADENVRMELDTLIGGGTIEKRISEDITYADIYSSEDNLWSFLFFTGYLKKVSERWDGKYIFTTMAIPNTEIETIYETQIRTWFENIVKGTDRKEFFAAIQEQDTEKMGRYLTELLSQSISTYDSREAFYHGFLLSLLTGFKDFTVKSNREAGDGRPDIVLQPGKPTDSAYLFEIKTRKKFNKMQEGLEEAFDQIRIRRYEEGVLDDGYVGVVSYGICFCRKSCIVGLYRKS